MNVHEISHRTGTDENKTVIVPLSNSALKVTLFEADYAELAMLGVGLPWRFSQGQVIVTNAGKRLNVARLILDADKGTKISFLDGDTRNLCRSNLIRIAGPARYRARDQLQRSFKRDVAEIGDFAR